ncbi:MAG: hypothetical protein SGJ24_05800 [Chloroflexota bacterium]|nr:hypothetical protein [Chloroflexota bacterium]
MSNYDPTQAELRRAQVVQERYAEMLMAKSHVVGLAIGYTNRRATPVGQPRTAEAPRQVCIVVMVDRAVANADLPLSERIPDELDGFPVEVQQTGMFSAGFTTE